MKPWAAIAAMSVLSTGALAGGISIGDFNAPGTSTYCFFRQPARAEAGEERYVFITGLPEIDIDDIDSLPLDPAETEEDITGFFTTAFMSIGDRFHELGMKSATSDGGHVEVIYTTYGKKPYEIVLEAQAGTDSYETQDFSGTITVSRDGASASVSFEGACGV